MSDLLTRGALQVAEFDADREFLMIRSHAAVCAEDWTLVAVTGPAGDPEAEAYAQLFAAAPDLLNACKMVQANVAEQLGDVGLDRNVLAALAAVRGAISRATGCPAERLAEVCNGDH